jgi:hypothetical protein
VAGPQIHTPHSHRVRGRKTKLVGMESSTTLAGTLRSSSEAIPDAASNFWAADPEEVRNAGAAKWSATHRRASQDETIRLGTSSSSSGCRFKVRSNVKRRPNLTPDDPRLAGATYFPTPSEDE